MNCPNCGAEIEKGSLYCTACGEDIHIVPDFEPEVEQSMRDTMDQIVEELQYAENTEEEISKKTSGKKHIILISGLLCLFILILTGIIFSIGYHREHSADYQLSKAIECVKAQNYDEAVAYYLRCKELGNNSLEIDFALAECYYAMDNVGSYEEALLQLIHNGNLDQTQLERAYAELINSYRARNDYLTIDSLLNACDNDSIRSKYQNLQAKAPEFSYKEGYYQEIIPLKLSSNTAGTIYYTLDGTEPDTNSLIYTAPIFLDNGEYIVKAVFVNEYGLVSDVVTKKYQIELNIPIAPEVFTASGEYSSPTMITVKREEEENIYYTMDGSVPTDKSNRYTTPIPMPLGDSHFVFAIIDEGGIVGEVAERSYMLRLNTDISTDMASVTLYSEMIRTGRIQDHEGHIGTGGTYQYRFQYPVTIGEEDYYLFAELHTDDTGCSISTGSYYVVQAYTCVCYKLQIDENNNYHIVEIL